MGRSLTSQAGPDAWKSQLRSHGYRLTVQRQLVLEAVASLERATPDAIASAVHRTASSLNISTVYRTLELLEQLGVLRHAHLGHGAPTYSLVTEQPPVHLVCQHCGRVQSAALKVMAGAVEQLRSEHGFVVDEGHLAISGTCRPCVESGRSEGMQAAEEP